MNRLLKLQEIRLIERSDSDEYIICCTGNTCRSPMAEALLKEALRKLGDQENMTFSQQG